VTSKPELILMLGLFHGTSPLRVVDLVGYLRPYRRNSRDESCRFDTDDHLEHIPAHLNPASMRQKAKSPWQVHRQGLSIWRLA